MFEQNFVFTGCDQCEVTPESLRIRDGPRTVELGWSLVEGGGVAVKDRNGTAALPSGEGAISQAMQQLASLRTTHDALWIKSRAGLMIGLIEQNHPKREALLGAFREHLRSHWFGETLGSAELAQRFAYQSRPRRGVGMPLMIMGAVMLITLLAILAMTFLR